MKQKSEGRIRAVKRRYGRYAAHNADPPKDGWLEQLKDPLTLFTAMLATSTVALTVVAGQQLSILIKTDDTFQRQTVISVRPWVGPADDVDAIGTSPLKFDEKGDVVMQYAIISKNFSNFAARNVFSYARLVIGEDLALVNKNANEACGANYVANAGSALFPGRKRSIQASASTVKGTEIILGPDGKAEAWFVGCIGYRDQFNVFYRTRFYYWCANPGTFIPAVFVPKPNTEIPCKFVEHHIVVDQGICIEKQCSINQDPSADHRWP